MNGAIKCQQISGGDGYATMGDGTQTYMFSFGPLSGLADIANGLPGTEFPKIFNAPYTGATLQPGDPATADKASDSPYLQGNFTGPLSFNYNGAIGQVPDADCLADPTCRAQLRAKGLANGMDGHVDPRQIMDVGVMNGNIPAPLMAIDEDDEFFLTLTNVGMIMRPDLFEQHTVHFHGYPNASAFYDGVPGCFRGHQHRRQLHLLLSSARCWHLLLALPHHPARALADGHGRPDLRAARGRTAGREICLPACSSSKCDLGPTCDSSTDILCTNPLPAMRTSASNNGRQKYAYNDGDG